MNRVFCQFCDEFDDENPVYAGCSFAALMAEGIHRRDKHPETLKD